MVKINVVDRQGTARIINAAMGGSLMEAIRSDGIEDILAMCGRCASCATCHVVVAPSDFSRLTPMSEDERDMLAGSGHLTETSRLACQIRVDESLTGMSVTIAPEE